MAEGNGVPKDPINEAIAATEGEQSIKMVHIVMQFATTGRPFFIDVPADLTPLEHLDFIHWAAHPYVGLAATAEKLGNPAGRLVTARSIPSLKQ